MKHFHLTLTAKQKLFLDAKESEVLFGGAAGGEELICGGAVLLLIVCALPAFRYLKEHLRSPSVPLLWGACFLLFFALSKIAEEMIVISFVGWISNLAAAVAFRLSDRWKVKPDVGV